MSGIGDALVTFVEQFTPEYKRLSDGKAKSFAEYSHLKQADEESFVQPKVVPNVLQTFLGCSPSDYTPEYRKGQEKPDFVPGDIFTDPVVFEAKCSDWNAAR